MTPTFGAPGNPRARAAGIDHFVWSHDEQGYASRLALALEEGVVPILRPAEASRASRWTEVLAWYGVTELEPDRRAVAGRSDGSSIRGHGPAQAIVVALDRHVHAVARPYARLTHRRFIALSRPEELVDLVAVDRPASVAVFGAAATLSFEVLALLQRTLEPPWGVLCARDLAALTFLVAKQLIGGRRSVAHGWGGIDAMRGTVASFDDTGALRVGRLRRGTADDWLVRRSWRELALVAHGEGSHLNLRSVVCCGAEPSGERDLRGAAMDGCGRRDGVPVCKRVHEVDARIVRFGDLRAQSVALFSCIGFSTTGQVYPSDNSLLLDAAEGHPSTVVTTDRIIPVISFLPILWLGLRRQGSAIGEVIDLLNELTVRHHGCATYLRFGDPLAGDGSPSPPVDVHTAPPPALVPPMHVLPTGSEIHEVFRPAYDSTVELLMPGRGRAVLLPRASHRGAPSLPPPATPEFERLRRGLERRATALLGAASLEASVRLGARLEGGAPPEISERLDVLGVHRAELDLAIHDALYSWDQARVTGLWTAELDERVRVVAEATAAWDACMCDLAQAFLFSRVLEEIVGLGRRSVEIREAGQCPRCGSPLRVERRVSAQIGTPELHRIDCPLCGGREAFTAGSWRLRASEPAALVPGTIESVDVHAVAPVEDAELPSAGGWLLTKVTDRGTGGARFEAKQPFDRHACLRIPIPRELTMELHIQKFLLVRDLGISLLRCRIPGVAAGGEPHGQPGPEHADG